MASESTAALNVDRHTGLYSSDDHLDLAYVPPTMWQDRVAQRWREQAPRVITTATGQTMWAREGRNWGIQGSKLQAGLKVVFNDAGLTEEPEPGVFRASTARYRLKDMDRDNIYAQVIYNFLDWGFQDPLLKEACIQAFNDWIAEFCAVNRERLIGLAVLPTHDPQAAIRELRRAADLGLRGAMFEFTGATQPIHDAVWDPFWSAAEESGTAISFHIMSDGHQGLAAEPKWANPARAAIACMMLNKILAELLFSGVTVRHPKLRLVLAESSLGWIPFVLERLDFEQENYKHLGGALPREKASNLFRRNFYCTFQEDQLGVKLIPYIGEDNVMWAADYPHGDGSFPRSMEVVDRIFAGASVETKRKATRDNMRKLYAIV